VEYWLSDVCENDGILCYAPGKYIDRMMIAYKQLLHEKPRLTVTPPLEKGDHPELETSELLLEEDVQKYQSLTSKYCR
jgi:hypothetical protein